jgi:hypothetical protein
VEAPSRDDGVPGEIGRLGYYLDDRRHVLCRSFVPYDRMRVRRLKDQCHTVLEGVVRCRFSYFGPNEEDGAVQWAPRWRTPQPPWAMKAELTVEEQGRQVSQSLLISLGDHAVEDGSSNE